MYDIYNGDDFESVSRHCHIGTNVPSQPFWDISRSRLSWKDRRSSSVGRCRLLSVSWVECRFLASVVSHIGGQHLELIII